jgi:hypothetical protein
LAGVPSNLLYHFYGAADVSTNNGTSTNSGNGANTASGEDQTFQVQGMVEEESPSPAPEDASPSPSPTPEVS